jgi:hypothetical protein
MLEPTGLTWLYALAVQAAGVVALVFLVALLGARSFGPQTGQSNVTSLRSLVSRLWS